jgi:hypothetical protein
MGGLGANYGASLSLSDYFWTARYSWTANQLLQNIAASAPYSAWTQYVDVASQMDTVNNMQTASAPLNTRDASTALLGSNGIHPAAAGMYQISDAEYRNIIATFFQGNE